MVVNQLKVHPLFKVLVFRCQPAPLQGGKKAFEGALRTMRRVLVVPLVGDIQVAPLALLASNLSVQTFVQGLGSKVRRCKLDPIA